MAIDKETRERATKWANANLKKEVAQKEDKAITPPFATARKAVERDYTAAKRLAVKVVKLFEGCNLFSYPDPASDLYKALSAHGLLKAYMDGTNRKLPENFEKLSGEPFTIGFGQTKGVTKDTVLTLAEAENDLFATVDDVFGQVLKVSPSLVSDTDEAIAAVISFCYNIGIGNYSHSTTCKKIAEGDMKAAGDSMLMWNKANGQVLAGLTRRRETERSLFLSSVA